MHSNVSAVAGGTSSCVVALHHLERNWRCQGTFLQVVANANSTASTATVSAVHASLPAKRTNVRGVAFPISLLLQMSHHKFKP
jgi:hypothetical protein